METFVSLLPIVAIFAIFWLVVIRPAQKRQRNLNKVQQELQIGDRVLSNSGIFGTVRSIEDNQLGVEVAPDVVVTMARQAIVGVPSNEEPAPTDEPEDDEPEDREPEGDQAEDVRTDKD